MEITNDWLKEKQACKEGTEWFNGQTETDAIKVLKKLMKEDHFDWANWTIVRLMTYKQYVGYAVFAAEQVLDIFEKKYPDDKRPRLAIEAAKKCIGDPSTKNKNAAADSADSAYATYATYAASYATDSAYAAYAAADAAYAAAAADSADSAYATYATYVAADSAAKKDMQEKIINYGVKLLEVK